MFGKRLQVCFFLVSEKVDRTLVGICSMPDEFAEYFDDVESAVEYLIAIQKAERAQEKQQQLEAERACVERELAQARELESEAIALTQNLKRWF